MQKKTKEPNPARWIEASSEVVVLLAMNRSSNSSSGDDDGNRATPRRKSGYLRERVRVG